MLSGGLGGQRFGLNGADNKPAHEFDPGRCAHKNTYMAVQFRRLAAKRGRKRAIVAIGHGLLVTGYYLLRKQRLYQDLGADYFDRINADRLKRYLVKRLESLGQKVTLEPREITA
jgi:hypothetical protein